MLGSLHDDNDVQHESLLCAGHEGSDIVDRASVLDATMAVGFARVGNRGALDISLPYDYVVASVSQVERQTTEMDDRR